MRTAIVLFTRDLRVHDNPALAGACAAAEYVVPLFVHDPGLPSSANRDRFLVQSLADLDAALRTRGGGLVVRTGDPVTEAIRLAGTVGAEGIAMAADVSRYAVSRSRRLARECQRHRVSLREFPGLTVVPPGALRPTGGGDHYKVFTPYHRAWLNVRWRPVAQTPPWVAAPPGFSAGAAPSRARAGASPAAVTGGETAARQRLAAFVESLSGGGTDRYADGHDDLAADATSRLSPYLHFGCVSPLEVARAVDSEAYRRQLCWRDFYHQVLAGFPDLPDKPYRAVDEDWVHDDEALQAWRAGMTGVPVVDAGMRQLRAEGFMHNRTRLITASYLTKTLGLDWRLGARMYAEFLLDADVANNHGNWQWVAGTGTDTKPYRRFNPVRQAHRFDPEGAYVRRYVPELAGIAGGAVHEPWRLPDEQRRVLDYPAPLAG